LFVHMRKSVGFPGREKSSVTRTWYAHRSDRETQTQSLDPSECRGPALHNIGALEVEPLARSPPAGLQRPCLLFVFQTNDRY
jgi:hypothetical protein